VPATLQHSRQLGIHLYLAIAHTPKTLKTNTEIGYGTHSDYR